MSKKKKIILLVAMVAVLAIATYVNVWLLNKNSDPGGDVIEAGNFFSKTRSDRQATRSYEIEVLNEILDTPGDEYAEARATAMTQKMKLVEVTETELLIETMLKAQGFEDAIVSIGTTSNLINVVVAADEMTKEDTVRIYNIIASLTSVTPSSEFIKILAI